MSNLARVVAYGGSGFVGSKVVERLAKKGLQVTSVSRTGTLPKHLQAESKTEWMQRIQWVSGDAFHPDASHLRGADAVVTLIGLPPLPDLNQASFDRSVAFNGAANQSVIEAAATCGVAKVVLVGAHVPWVMQSEKFGYWVGKQQGLRAAQAFAEQPGHHAIVLQPSAVYGTRHLQNGMAIPLGWFMGPVAAVHRLLPSFVANLLPYPFVSVDSVAQAVADSVTDRLPSSPHAAREGSGRLTILDAGQLAFWPTA